MESIHDVGIDWLTFTIMASGTDYRRALTLAETEMRLIAGEGHSIENVSVLGYRGFAVPHLFYGQRWDSLMIRAGGHIAKRLAESFKRAGIDTKCSRIDFQVTTKRNPRKGSRIEHLRKGVSSRGRTATGKRKSKITTIQSAGTGGTLSLGSRSSPCYVRIYDKTAEQRDRVEPGLWRWEVEYKGPASTKAWREVVESADVDTLAASFVVGALKKHGIEQRWFGQAAKAREMHYWSPTTMDRRMKWLESTVRPALFKMAEMGKGREAIECLGIPELLEFINEKEYHDAERKGLGREQTIFDEGPTD